METLNALFLKRDYYAAVVTWPVAKTLLWTKSCNRHYCNFIVQATHCKVFDASVSLTPVSMVVRFIYRSTLAYVSVAGKQKRWCAFLLRPATCGQAWINNFVITTGAVNRAGANFRALPDVATELIKS
jgi:hypothetical protein